MGNVKSLFLVPPPPTHDIFVPRIEGCQFLLSIDSEGKVLEQCEKVKLLLKNWDVLKDEASFIFVDWWLEPGTDESNKRLSHISSEDAKEMSKR